MCNFVFLHDNQPFFSKKIWKNGFLPQHDWSRESHCRISLQRYPERPERQHCDIKYSGDLFSN